MPESVRTSQMPKTIFADVVLVVHGLVTAFALTGCAFAWLWPRLAWVHLPLLAWSVMVGVTGWACPLTLLELKIRRAAGESTYEGGFIDHHVGRLVHANGLPRGAQASLALLLAAVNLAAYAALIRS